MLLASVVFVILDLSKLVWAILQKFFSAFKRKSTHYKQH